MEIGYDGKRQKQLTLQQGALVILTDLPVIYAARPYLHVRGNN